ncbi:hypothetical protein [Streptomyces sp. NPDC001843]|uniref:hypothetical protein n=1 Tax=Streptomyces sp. NPDC001843 TaxID=3364617 RepID=UPI0036BD1660
MADEHYRWLNRRTAERLLRGESLEAVDPSAREQAGRLAEALGALSAEATRAETELPGEEAALAAFRKAREARADAAAQLGAGHAADGPADVGLIRIGARSHAVRRPGWIRPARLAVTAALAAGALGGVAMAAGSGVLPTPFGDHTPGPGPGASVSADPTPRRPAASRSAGETGNGTSGLLPPGGGASGTPGGTSSPGAEPGKPAGGATGSPNASHGAGTAWSGAPSACRDIRAGKELTPDRKHALDGVAGGSALVWKYCKGVLGAAGNTTGDEDGHGRDDHGTRNDGDGKKGNGGQGGGDDGHGGRGGDHHHRDGDLGTPTPPTFAPLVPQHTAVTPVASPSPTYTAL